MRKEISQFQRDYLTSRGDTGLAILARIEESPESAVMWPRSEDELVEQMTAYQEQVKGWQRQTPETFYGGESQYLVPSTLCHLISEKVRFWITDARAKAKLEEMGYKFEGGK